MKKYLKFIFCFLLVQLSFWCLVVRDGYSQTTGSVMGTAYGARALNPWNAIAIVTGLLAIPFILSLWGIIKLRNWKRAVMWWKLVVVLLYVICILTGIALIGLWGRILYIY